MVGKIVTGIAIIGAFSVGTVGAETLTVGAKVGTLGGGLEMEKQLTDWLSGRVGINYFSYSYDDTEDDIEYEFDATLQTIGAILDWHPFTNGFRISAGLMLNGNDLEANGKPTNGTYEIGDNTYASSQIGNLSGSIDFSSTAPYFGIGTSTSYGEKGQFGFTFELGVMYQGEADVEIRADGPLANNQAFQDDLRKEEQDLQDDLSSYEWYPVISFGMIYRF